MGRYIGAAGLTLLMCVLGLSILLPTVPARANPIIINNVDKLAVLAIKVGLFSVLETAIIIWILFLRGKVKNSLILPILWLINLVTMPLTTRVLIALEIMNVAHAPMSTIIAEVSAVAVEAVALYAFFRVFYRDGDLKKPVPLAEAAVISLVANTASFLLGFFSW